MTEHRLRLWQHLLVLSLVVAIIVSRRPDALFNPQFYSEDGWVWYADAWNLGPFRALILPEGGYLNTLPRLVCALAILLPLKAAPLFLNWTGILIQALPVNVLLSSRCSNWGPLGMRALQAAIYLALPNSSELHVTITNAHWHLALAGCFLAFSNPPLSFVWKLFDIAILIMVGLTGPWALVLTPLTFVFWWTKKQPWSVRMAGLLALCAAIQVIELIRHSSDRQQTIPLGATPELFARLLAGQVYAGAIWGQNSLAVHSHLALILMLSIMAAATLLWGLLKLRLEMRLFIAFAAVIFVAALRTPLVTGQGTQWQLLATDKGARYWFFPMLALLWTLLWAASQDQQRALRLLSLLCFAVMLRAVIHDWRYAPYKDFNFGTYVHRFEVSPPGSTVQIPVYPIGRLMALVKH